MNVIIDFPEGRTQRFVFQGDISEGQTKTQGAPQGGVNSLAYFNLSVADFVSLCITESASSSIAVDTKFPCAGFIIPISGQPTDNAQKEIQSLKDSFENRKLFLNAKKTQGIDYSD